MCMLVLRLSMPCQFCLHCFVLSGAKAPTVSTEYDATVGVTSKQLFVLRIPFVPSLKKRISASCSRVLQSTIQNPRGDRPENPTHSCIHFDCRVRHRGSPVAQRSGKSKLASGNAVFSPKTDEVGMASSATCWRSIRWCGKRWFSFTNWDILLHPWSRPRS